MSTLALADIMAFLTLIGTATTIGFAWNKHMHEKHKKLEDRIGNIDELVNDVLKNLKLDGVEINKTVEVNVRQPDLVLQRVLEEHEVLKSRLDHVETRYGHLLTWVIKTHGMNPLIDLEKARPIGYRDSAQNMMPTLRHKRSWMKRMLCWVSMLVHGSFIYVKSECTKCGYEHSEIMRSK